MTPATTTVSGKVTTADAWGAPGSIAFKPQQSDGISPVFSVSSPVIAKIERDGTFTTRLIPSHDPSWENGPVLYDITLRAGKQPTQEWRNISIPDVLEIDLVDLLFPVPVIP